MMESNRLDALPENLAEVGRTEKRRFAYFLNDDSLISCAQHNN